MVARDDQVELDFSTQQEHLERIVSKLEETIMDYCLAHPRFHMQDLVVHCQGLLGAGNVAPDSPSRALRSLRQDKVIDYAVLSRRGSLYQIKRIGSVVLCAM